MSTIQLNSKDFASQTSSAEPVIASTVTGSPAIALTNMTGTIPTAVSGPSLGALISGHNVVGTYGFCRHNADNTSVSAGGTVTSGNLEYSNVGLDRSGQVTFGTWRCMGHFPSTTNSAEQTTLWARVA